MFYTGLSTWPRERNMYRLDLVGKFVCLYPLLYFSKQMIKRVGRMLRVQTEGKRQGSYGNIVLTNCILWPPSMLTISTWHLVRKLLQFLFLQRCFLNYIRKNISCMLNKCIWFCLNFANTFLTCFVKYTEVIDKINYIKLQNNLIFFH